MYHTQRVSHSIAQRCAPALSKVFPAISLRLASGVVRLSCLCVSLASAFASLSLPCLLPSPLPLPLSPRFFRCGGRCGFIPCSAYLRMLVPCGCGCAHTVHTNTHKHTRRRGVHLCSRCPKAFRKTPRGRRGDARVGMRLLNPRLQPPNPNPQTPNPKP